MADRLGRMSGSRVRCAVRTLAPVVLVVGTGASALAAPAAAAPCEQPTVRAAADEVAVVFSATVEATEQVRRAGERVREVTASVDRIYQGDIAEGSATITMPLPDQPQVGEEWYFFADGQAPDLTLPACSGSRPVTDRVTRQVEDALGAGEVYVEPAPAREPLRYRSEEVTALPSLSRVLAPGASLALFALLGLILTRRRR